MDCISCLYTGMVLLLFNLGNGWAVGSILQNSVVDDVQSNLLGDIKIAQRMQKGGDDQWNVIRKTIASKHEAVHTQKH